MWRALLAGAVVVSCGGDPTMDVAATCAKPAGLYKESLTKESGNCSFGSNVVNFDKPNGAVGTFGDGCRGTGTPSANMCEYSTEFVCPLAMTEQESAYCRLYSCSFAPEQAVTMKVNWTKDGKLGTGTIAIQVRGTMSRNCAGVYRVEYTAL